MSRVYNNQRRTLRRAIQVECQIVRERDFKLVADQSIDISREGMQVVACEKVLTGENLIVSFRLPGGPWFDAEATVARVVHGRRRGDRARALGLRFDTLEPDAAAVLEQSIRGVPPPLPSRAPPI